MMPLVSIMIPTYNQPEYIQTAVKSALAQDYPHLEVIVSDDSTNNDTRELLSAFVSDKRFSYFQNTPALGRVANYRKLVHELAKGDWSVILDGDDYYIDPSYISKAVKVIAENPSLVLVGAGIQVLYESTGTIVTDPLTEADKIFDGKKVLVDKLALPNHQTDIYRRSLARELDFYRDPSMGSDSESLFRLCLLGDVAYLADIVAVWRIHSSNTTFTLDVSRQIKESVFIDSVYDSAVEIIGKRAAREWRTDKYKRVSSQLFDIAFKANNYSQVIKLLIYFGKYIGLRNCFGYLKKLVSVYRLKPRVVVA